MEASSALRCTHYDAFRFFHPSAQPMNSVSMPTRDFQEENEQPGECNQKIHLSTYLSGILEVIRWSDHVLHLSSTRKIVVCSGSLINPSPSSSYLPLSLSRSISPSFSRPLLGCVHAAMDLFKYAYQLYPFVSSDLLRECLVLAVTARKIDMRASPYDVSLVPDCAGKYGYCCLSCTWRHCL